MRAGIDSQLSALELESEPELLSRREIEVLRLLAAGFSNHEIADRLMIAESTVKMHLKHLYGKLDVHNRVQAVVQAQAMQLLM